MRLREWNPATAAEAELHAWLRSYNSALAVDLPSDPPWQIDRLRDYLTVTMPGERRLTWLVEDESHPGDVLGYGRLLVMEGLGVIELNVAPGGRRQHVGERLVSVIADRALAEGLSSLGVEAIGGTAAASFYASLGFVHAYTEMRSILELDSVDWPHIAEMADGLAHGYRVEFYVGDLPDELLAGLRRGEAGAPPRPDRGPGPASPARTTRTGCGPACAA